MAADPHPPVPRLLRSTETEAAAALIRLAFAAQPLATDPPSSALGETGAAVAAGLAAGGGGFVVEGEGGLAAVLLVADRAGALYCGRLAVHPAARGRGLAARLMAAAEAEARRRGLARLQVRVRLSLPGNLRFFEGLGFGEVGRDAHAGYAAPTTAVLEKRI